jgi:hypothetical protein
MSLFSWIGDLFNAAEKAWHKLEPEVQAALLHGSGVINVINQNLQATPQAVFDLIDKKFPDLTKENLTAGLAKVAAAFGIAEQTANPDLLTTIEGIQKYLSTLKGNIWQGISSAMAQILSIAIAPNETPFEKIVQLIEWVYKKIVPQH